jgi:hypothetical protein
MLLLQGPGNPTLHPCTRPDQQGFDEPHRVLLTTLAVQAQAGRASA